MGFSAADVKALRETTGVGMMDCKKALSAVDGDMEKAVAWLREKGLAAAQKKAGRVAAEGMVAAVVNNGVAAIVEVNAETDFVAKNDLFVQFVNDIAAVVCEKAPANLEELMALPYPNSDMTVEQAQQDKVLVIGENIKIRRFARYAEGFNVPYVHMGGRIGVLVNMDVSENIQDKPEVTELGRDLAMQIAAMRPTYLDMTAVDAEELAREQEIQLAKAIEENKAKNLPEDKARMIAENMVKGRINKFYEEICLMNQPYVKENKLSVAQHVAAVAKALSGSISILGFTRFETGEGIEKKQENFADEIASMVK